MTAATATTATETTLFLVRRFKATPEEVFRAWTDPGELTQWFASTKDHAGCIAEVDLRVGGRFRMGMKHLPTGKDHVATGIYREIRFPERLVFTWSWEGKPENGESRITIDLRDDQGETEMRFTHEFFPNRAVRDNHQTGWTGCFENLQKVLEA